MMVYILTQSTAERRKESGQSVTAEYCQKLLRLGRTTEGEELCSIALHIEDGPPWPLTVAL